MIDLDALAKAAGFANVMKGKAGETPFDILTSCGVKARDEAIPAPLPVNTSDAEARYRKAFAEWASDKPKRALVVAQAPILMGMDNGKRVVVSRLAAR